MKKSLSSMLVITVSVILLSSIPSVCSAKYTRPVEVPPVLIPPYKAMPVQALPTSLQPSLSSFQFDL